MDNITLIGMPACGKSTTGVLLAKALNKGFVDTDLLIQQKEEKTLQEIINEKGNEYFHRVEEAVLMSFDERGYVIATGGSAVYYPKAIEKFRDRGIIIYIRITVETVLERLNNITSRGVTLEKGQTLEELYKQRIPLYEKSADIVVDGDNLKVEELIDEIIKKIKEYEIND